MSCDSLCIVQSVPGPPGDEGDAGTDGIDGLNAFTLLDGGFTMPAEGGTVVTSVDDNRWIAVNQVLYVQSAGWMRAVAVNANGTGLTLLNLEDTASSEYTENAAAGTAIPTLSKVSPGGLQGAQGVSPADALLASANLLDLDNPATARTNLGLVPGTNVQAQDALLQAIANLVTAADQMIYTTGVDTPVMTALTAFARTILDDLNAAAVRATLALGSIATQNSNAVAITGGSLVGAISVATTLPIAGTDLTASGEIKLNGKVFTAASTLQSLLAASAISPNAGKVRVVGNGGAVVLTSTPSIGVGTDDGQLLIVQGTSDANTVTLQDSGTLAGSGMRLGAATRLLGEGDISLFTWDAALAEWLEMAFSNI